MGTVFRIAVSYMEPEDFAIALQNAAAFAVRAPSALLIAVKVSIRDR